MSWYKNLANTVSVCVMRLEARTPMSVSGYNADFFTLWEKRVLGLANVSEFGKNFV